MAKGKTCVLCGKPYPATEFKYGGRSDNPYCVKCNREYAQICRLVKEMRLKRGNPVND